MWITVTLDSTQMNRDLRRLERRAEKALVDEVHEAVEVGVDAAVAYARTHHAYKDRTGALTGSIVGDHGIRDETGATGYFEATAAHASYIEEGTQPHEIEARNAQALHWIDEAGEHFRRKVHHPGTAAMPFLAPAAEVAEDAIIETIKTRLPPKLRVIFGDRS